MAGWYRILSVCCWFGGLIGCGGAAESSGANGGTASASGGVAGGTVGPRAGAPAAGGTSQAGNTSKGGTASGGAPFVDPMCPTIDPPPAIVECDPLSAAPGCAAGQGCYPYVQHPFGDGCDTETFGAVCLPAGDGTQGVLCGDGHADCAPGYICVIGAHAGARCAKLCSFASNKECPLGMICGDTDIDGYGVCD